MIVSTLNVNGWGLRDLDDMSDLRSRIKNSIKNSKDLLPDVFVLTEVNDRQSKEILKFEDYCVAFGELYPDPDPPKKHYQVGIGVKKDFADITDEDKSESTGDIDLLRVRCAEKRTGKKFTVIGCRFAVGAGNEEDYDSRGKAFDEILVPLIEKTKLDYSDDPCIIAGDFNNARHRGDLTQPFNAKNYSGLSQVNYNLHLIKDRLEELGFEMADINDGKGIVTLKKKGIVPLKKMKKCDDDYYIIFYGKNKICDDHIFFYGLKKEDCESVSTDDQFFDHLAICAELSL